MGMCGATRVNTPSLSLILRTSDVHIYVDIYCYSYDVLCYKYTYRVNPSIAPISTHPCAGDSRVGYFGQEL